MEIVLFTFFESVQHQKNHFGEVWVGYFSTLINKETLKEIASADSRVAFAQENTAGYRMKSCLSYLINV